MEPPVRGMEPKSNKFRAPDMVEKQSVPIRGRNRYRNRYRFGFPTIPMPIPTLTRRKKRTYFGAHPCPKKGANSLEFRQYVGRSELHRIVWRTQSFFCRKYNEANDKRANS